MAEKRTSQQVAETEPTGQRPKQLGSPRRRPSWEQHIRDLKAFKKANGHCNVPAVYHPNFALGRWVANLRKRKNRGELTEDNIFSLDALGFCWVRLKTPRLPKKPT